MNYVNQDNFIKNKKKYFFMMKKILENKLRYVCTYSELESIMDEILFNSMRMFKDRGFNFSTYLHKACRNKSGKILEAKIKINNNEKNILSANNCKYSDFETIELNDVLEELKKRSPELYDVLVDSYLNCMTNVEIGRKNGYCPENARKKIKKALKICQKLVYD